MATSMQSEDDPADVLVTRLITHAIFDDVHDVITFSSPVCLTGITVTALPAAAGRQTQATLNVFARDLQIPDAARFACIYEGLRQPATGRTSAPLPSFLTDHVVLRGKYQTLPLSLHGFRLDKVAAIAPTPSESQAVPLTFGDAVPRFADTISALPRPCGADLPALLRVNFAQQCEPVLRRLLKHWRRVETTPSKITTNHFPGKLLQEALAAADEVCAALAAGGMFPVCASLETSSHDHPMPYQELIDMAMGWCGLLARIGSPIAASPSVAACGNAGLAACVLIAAHAPSAAAFLVRQGHLLLADVLQSLAASDTHLRHAAGCCLLLTQSAGALGCEALLGWYARGKFVQWKGRTLELNDEDYEAMKDAIIPQVDGANDGDGDGGDRRMRGGGGKGGGTGRQRQHKSRNGSSRSGAPRDNPKESRDEDTPRSKTTARGIDADRMRRGEAIPDRWVMGAEDNTLGNQEAAADRLDVKEESAGTRHRRGRKPSADEGRRKSEQERSRHSRSRSPKRRRSIKRRSTSRSRRKEHSRDKERMSKRRKDGDDDDDTGHREKRAVQRKDAATHRRDSEPRSVSKNESRSRREKKEPVVAPPSVPSEIARLQKKLDARAERIDVSATRSEPRRLGSTSPSGQEPRPGVEKRKRGRSPSPLPQQTQRYFAQPNSTGKSRRDTHISKQPSEADVEAQRLEWEDQQYLRLSGVYWDEKLTAFSGVYASLAAAMVRLQPKTFASISTAVLRILRFYENAATFVTAAKDLTHRLGGSGSDGSGTAVPPREAVEIAAVCGSSLAALSKDLALPCPSTARSSRSHASLVHPLRSDQILAVSEPSSLLVQLLQARRLVTLIPAMLRAPAAAKARLESVGDPAAGASCAAMLQQLLAGVRPLLAVLTSSVSGLQVLAQKPAVCLELVAALEAAGETSAASALQSIVLAAAAVDVLCTSSLSSTEFSSAAAGLKDLIGGKPSQRMPALQMIALRASEVFPRLVQMLALHGSVLRQAAGMMPEETCRLDGEAFAGLVKALPALETGLEACVALAECDDLCLVARWAPHAEAVLPQLAFQAELLCGCPSAGATSVFADIETARGGFEAACRLSQGGFAGLINSLIDDLPGMGALVQSSCSRKFKDEGAEAEGKSTMNHERDALHPPPSPFGGDDDGDLNKAIADDDVADANNTAEATTSVHWSEVRSFWDDAERRGRAHSALRLLSSILSSNGVTGREAALEMHTMDGVRLIRVALMTATEAFAAAQADRQWARRTGAAIDPASSAVNKRKASQFLETVSALTSAYLRRLRGIVSIDDPSCLATLLQAHAVTCSDEGNLIRALGNAGEATAYGPNAAVVAARRHLVVALRCFIEHPEWVSHPLHAFIAGPDFPQHPVRRKALLHDDGGAAVDQTRDSLKQNVPPLPPRQMFAASCLLGDLCTPEWPPAGRHTAPLQPPSDRKWRLTLAQAVEAAQPAFEHLVASCIETESVLLRASITRLIARSSGLGGGMGAFVISPLVTALAAVPASKTPSHDARRLLEQLVPLVYRPALKAALLDSQAVKTLATIIGAMATASAGVPPTVDPAEASAIVTMAIECLTVLCNPDVALDPGAPAEHEVPPAAQGTAVATALLEHLSALGVNAELAHRVLRSLAATAPGRAALRMAAAGLHATALGQEPPSSPDMRQVLAAAQWVATRYWQAASQAQNAQTGSQTAAPGASRMKEIYADVADIMKEVCAAMEADTAAPTPPPPPAPLRFAAATQAAIAAAAAAGLATDSASSKNGEMWYDVVEARTADGPDAVLSVCDPATRMFWRNVKARVIAQSRMAAAAAFQRYKKRDILPDEDLTLMETLHPPLTAPLRPQFESMAAGRAGIDEEQGAEESNVAAAAAAADASRVVEPVVEGEGQEQGKDVNAEQLLHAAQSEQRGEEEAAITEPSPAGAAPAAGAIEGKEAFPVPVVAPDFITEASEAQPPLGAEVDIYADLGGGGASLAAAVVPPQPVPAEKGDAAGPSVLERAVEAGAKPEEGPVAEIPAVSSPAIDQKANEVEDAQQQHVTPVGSEPQQLVAKEAVEEEGEGQQIRAPENEESNGDKGLQGLGTQENGGHEASEDGAGAIPKETSKEAAHVGGAADHAPDLTKLLSDPARLSRMLAENPALREALKAKLGQK